MRDSLRTACAAALLLWAAPSPATETEIDIRPEVDVALVLAVDVSRSMDDTEQWVQREGYIAAFRHPEVHRAVAEGLIGAIAVTYLEWAGSESLRVVVPWTRIDGAETAEAFAQELAWAPISSLPRTSISGALQYSGIMFDGSPYQGLRRVIDLSGDGPNNDGRSVARTRDRLIREGVVINGLPIMVSRADGLFSLDNLDHYYEDCVIGGPGAFLIAVNEIEQLPNAIRRKLVLEIAGRQPVQPARIILASGTVRDPVDCFIGEKLYDAYLRGP